MDTRSDMRPKIVVIDDEGELLSLLERWLGGLYRVTALYGSEWTYEQVAALKPDLVLLDVNMPEKGGYDLCRQLRADPRFAATPVVFLTATPRTEEFELAGGTRWLTKPSDRKELLAAIAEELGLKLRVGA